MAVEATKKALPEVSVFDTLKYARNLKRDGGISEKQADAHAEGLLVALRGVAKGSDILALGSDILALKSELKSDILALKSELKSDIKVLKSDIKVLKSELKADIKVLKSEFKADIKVVEARLTTIEGRLDAHQEQMRGLRQMMMIGFSMNGGLILLVGLLLVLK